MLPHHLYISKSNMGKRNLWGRKPELLNFKKTNSARKTKTLFIGDDQLDQS